MKRRSGKSRGVIGQIGGAVLALSLVLPLGLTLGAEDAAAQQQQGCKRPAGAKILMPKVVGFDIDSVEIGDRDKAELQAMAERFAGNPSLEVCVIGQSDRSGDAEYNRQLALKRANAVAEFLQAKGLAAMNYQVRTRGQAFSDESWLGKLIGSEEKKSDRRVEVVVMQR